jgi:hypothetical protein
MTSPGRRRRTISWRESVRDGLTRHLAQVPRASEMLAEVVHLRFGRMQDARTSKQIIQMWVAAPEKDAFYFLTQIQALHGVTQIANSLRYMWVVSKESRKLQSPLFDPQMMARPNLQVHPGFASLASYWIRLDRATRRISLGQVLDRINSFYTEHGMQVPTIIDVLVLQSNTMAAEPSFLLCMASLKSLAQLASDLQPLGLLRVKLGMDFFIQLGHAPTAAIQRRWSPSNLRHRRLISSDRLLETRQEEPLPQRGSDQSRSRWTEQRYKTRGGQ